MREFRSICIWIGFMTLSAFVAFGQGKHGPNTVSALELQSGTQIIGLLGVPLGQLVTIRGKIVESNTKEGRSVVLVEEVDGKALSRMLQLRYSVWQWGNIGLAPLPVDKILKLRVYETGGMVGIPIEAMKETAFIQTEGWGFDTTLVLLNRE